MEEETKSEFVKEYLRQLRVVLKSKLSAKNKIIAIDTWAALLRYGAGIMKWTTEESTSLDRKTRKVLILQGTFPPKSDVDRLYLLRQLGGRRLISCKGCVLVEENSLDWYLKNSVGPLLEKVKEVSIIETEQSKEKTTYKKETSDFFENAWKNEEMCGQFKSDMGEEIDK